MARNVQTIRIESIGGGLSQYDKTTDPTQFRNALAINIDSDDSSNSGSGSGPTVITPTQVKESDDTTGDVPLWMVSQPKSQRHLYLYGASGSVYLLNTSSETISGLGDLNDGGDSYGNGAAYYDNYLYFARATTVARYGPLNGTAAFTDDFWTVTLGKTALEQQAYPARNSSFTDADLPNHVMHRHSDGRLYFADTIAGQGVIHYIKTSKTTVEGDTDAGSKYGALYLPYGYFVTDIDSYGEDLVISAFEGRSSINTNSYSSTSSHEGRASLFFWDTVSDNYYRHIQREFPDQIITALENANGVLYTFSSNISPEPTGVRIMRYLGGYSFEQVALIPWADTPFPGGTISVLNQIRFASSNQHFENNGLYGCVWSVGSQQQPLSNAVFCVAGARNTNVGGHAIGRQDGDAPWASLTWFSYAKTNTTGYLAYYDSSGGGEDWDTDKMDSVDGNAFWRGPDIVIGSRFKILKVKLFVLSPDSIISGSDVRVYIRKDYGSKTQIGTIDNANYPSKSGAIILKPNGLICEHSFSVDIHWFGTKDVGIFLPIEIEYEIIPDD